MRWIAGLTARAWAPFGLAIGGRWISSGFEVLASALLAHAMLTLSKEDEGGVPVPAPIVEWLSASEAPLIATLLLAHAVVLTGKAIKSVVEWCLPWIHLRVNEQLTPDIVEAAVEPAANRLLDPPTAVQRWLLKLDISYFVYESVAATIGHVGTIVIILLATFQANTAAGVTALAGLALWVVASVPLTHRALHASRVSAETHEVVGRIIRDSAMLRTGFARPSLRLFWRRRNAKHYQELHRAIKHQGLWNVALFGTLGFITRALPIVALLAAASTGTLGSALVVMLFLTRLAAPLGSLANTLPWIQQNLISVQRVFELVATDRDRITSAPPPFAPTAVRFADWLVQLPGAGTLAYGDGELRKGRLLCIVGPSGSGKSSLLESLAGHLPATGKLFVDDHLVAPLDPRWRETCGYVRQEPELVPGSLLDNLGQFPGWSATPALSAAVDAVLAGRPSGAAGSVAMDDKGVSVGQRRAIAVLRVLGSDAPVILLDEPLAGIDDGLVPPLATALVKAVQAGKIVAVTAHEHDLVRLRPPPDLTTTYFLAGSPVGGTG